MRRLSSTAAVTVAVLTLADFPGKAALITLSNPSQFSGNETLITFSGLAVFARPTSINGVGFQLTDGTGGPEVAFDPNRPREFGPAEGTILQNITSSGPNTPPLPDFSITFPTAVQRLGFELRTDAGDNIVVNLFQAGKQIDSITFVSRDTDPVPADFANELYFYGFQAASPFDQIVLSARNSTGYLELDNVRFEAIPEPGNWCLLSSGLLTAWLLKRWSSPPTIG